jgi:hypothetical protein
MNRPAVTHTRTELQSLNPKDVIKKTRRLPCAHSSSLRSDVRPTMLRSRAVVAALILVLSSAFLLLVTSVAAAEDEDHSALRGLQTSYTHSTTRRCPANQRYLSNVQFGCPASCDQPVPLCYAAIGPGCGCPKGTVLAGSSRPRNRKRCIQLQQCNKKPVTTPTYAPPRPATPPPLTYCPNNVTPLANVNCGRGGTRCPTGSTCNIDPLDRFAVCCPDTKYEPPAPTPPSSSQCPDMSKPLANAYCGRGGSPCPTGYGCITDPGDRFAICCREKTNYMPPLVPPAASCVVTGCSGEVCTDKDPEISTICVVPSCATQCVARWGVCQADSYTGTCGWDLRANAGRYQQCLGNC